MKPLHTHTTVLLRAHVPRARTTSRLQDRRAAVIESALGRASRAESAAWAVYLATPESVHLRHWEHCSASHGALVSLCTALRECGL